MILAHLHHLLIYFVIHLLTDPKMVLVSPPHFGDYHKLFIRKTNGYRQPKTLQQVTGKDYEPSTRIWGSLKGRPPWWGINET